MFTDNQPSKKYYYIPQLEKIPFIIHGFGTRFFQEKDIRNNPRWKGFELVLLEQIHSDILHVIKESPEIRLEGDAMVTNRSGFFLGIRTADCLPVFLVETQNKVIAAVHCGWRGTSKQILPKVIKKMKNDFGCKTSSLLVLFGPSIEAACYEVGSDVYQEFQKNGLSLDSFARIGDKTGKYHFNLRQANITQLRDLGIRNKNIFSLDLCTFCRPDLHSFRRDKEKAGRLLNFIGLTL
jgi:YfiH family protein